VAYQGTVANFYKSGLVSAQVNLHYGCNSSATTGACTDSYFPDDPAFEIEYAPYGVDSGLCLGVPSTASQGEGVTLQPCGVSSKTVWILDTYDSWSSFGSDGYYQLINGSDTNFSQPFVLTYPANAYPTDMPRPQLTVTTLTGFTHGPLGPELGTVAGNQP
jgi:hypothetical protein